MKIKKVNELNFYNQSDLPHPLDIVRNFNSVDGDFKSFLEEIISTEPDLSFDMNQLKSVISGYIDILEDDGWFEQRGF